VLRALSGLLSFRISSSGPPGARAGAQVHRGDLDDLASLRSGAAASDGVIHTAFIHGISQATIGDATSNCVRRASARFGLAFYGSPWLRPTSAPSRPSVPRSRALIAHLSSLLGLGPNARPPRNRGGCARSQPANTPLSEEAALAMLSRGGRASVVRPPVGPRPKQARLRPVHDRNSSQKGASLDFPATASTAGLRCTGSILHLCSGWHWRRALRDPGIMGWPAKSARLSRPFVSMRSGWHGARHSTGSLPI
jgi:hypothetical protein